MSELKPAIVEALNSQILKEYTASYLYREAYFHFEMTLFPGTAAFFKVPFPNFS